MYKIRVVTICPPSPHLLALEMFLGALGPEAQDVRAMSVNRHLMPLSTPSPHVISWVSFSGVFVGWRF